MIPLDDYEEGAMYTTIYRKRSWWHLWNPKGDRVCIGHYCRIGAVVNIYLLNGMAGTTDISLPFDKEAEQKKLSDAVTAFAEKMTQRLHQKESEVFTGWDATWENGLEDRLYEKARIVMVDALGEGPAPSAGDLIEVARKF